jgi:hypothetical protein
VERRSGVPQFPSPQARPLRAQPPRPRSTLPNSGKHGLAPPHNGAGVESFPTTLPQSLCHSRNAATGRDHVAHVAEAAGPPHVESYAHGDGFQVAQVPAPVAIYSYGCARLGGGARGHPLPMALLVRTQPFPDGLLRTVPGALYHFSMRRTPVRLSRCSPVTLFFTLGVVACVAA